MRTARATFVVAALAAGSFLLGIAPVRAEISAPGDGTIVGEQPTITGSIDVGDSADGVNITITGEGETLTAGGSCGSTGVTCRDDVVDFAVPVSLARNGTYGLKVTGYHTRSGSLDEARSVTNTGSFGLEVPPSAPKRLIAEPDGARRRVTLTWQENPEPDVLSYQVRRSVDGGGFSQVGTVDAGGDRTVTYVDDVGDGGRLTYQVVAVRRGASAGRVVAGPPASASTTVDRLPPPTTTTTSTTEPPAETGTGGTTSTTGGSGATAAGDTSRGGTGGLQPTASAAAPRITPSSGVDLSGYRPNTAAPRLGPTPTPADEGFDEQLPYGTPQPEEVGPPETAGEAALPVGTLTETRSSNRKAMLSFLASAMLLFMLSMHLRWLLRRATAMP